MSTQNIEFVNQWLKKADNDLITARQTLLLPEAPTDTVTFHAQQAVEKSLKAFLTFQQIEFPKIHELVRLLDLAIPAFPELDQFRKACAEMSGYAIDVRYPLSEIEPSRDEAIFSVDIAEEIVCLIRDKIGMKG